MKISYPIGSKFTAPCQQCLTAQRAQLEAGEAVSIPLGAGGYSGQATVIIRDGDADGFDTDWNGSDPTRFPARLKAGAMALRACGCAGTFAISHADGIVSVKML